MVEMAGEDQEPQDYKKAEEPVSEGAEPPAEHGLEAEVPAEAEVEAEDSPAASAPQPEEAASRGGKRSKEAPGDTELDGPPGEDAPGASVNVAERPKAVPEAPAPACPICSLTWDDHNIARVRECMAELEQALALAEKARIRASLTLPNSAHNHRTEPVEAAPEPETER